MFNSLGIVFLGLSITLRHTAQAMWQAWVARSDANFQAYLWACEVVERVHKNVLQMTIKVIVNGEVPTTGHIVIFGNHPDTVSLVAWVQGLMRTFYRHHFAPTARTWTILGLGISAIGGLVFDRNDGQKAINDIQKWLTNLGRPSVITLFPDGRRGFPERIATEGKKDLEKWGRGYLIPVYRYTLPAKRGGVLALRQSLPDDTVWFRCTVSLNGEFRRIWQIAELRRGVIVIQFDRVSPPPADVAGVENWLEQQYGFINGRIGEIRGSTQ